MKRYTLCFLGAFAVSIVLALALMLIGLAGWFMSKTPLWFDLLCAILGLLPFLAVGELAGRQAKRKNVCAPRRGLAALLVAMAVAGTVMWRLEGGWLYVLGWPGMLVGNLPVALFDLKYRWGYQVYLHWVEPISILLAHLLLPLLFHLGWRWGENN